MIDLLPQLEPESPTGATPRTVLVVDDDLDQAEVLRVRLQRQGFQVKAVHNGADAIKSVREARPDLVLMDLCLPDMSGLEAAAAITDDAATCDVPVIALSGLEEPDLIRTTRSAGCCFYLRKPYDPHALLVLVEAALRQADSWYDAP